MLRTIRTQALLAIATLALCELLLQMIAATTLRSWIEPTPPWLRDAAVEKRGNPTYPGHDARGYRNERTLQRADVVAIGDSFTYGVGVERQEAWPVLVSRLVRRDVYSMAHGGYGPWHYERLLGEALSLRPRAVIVGVYMGNDLFDSYWAYARDPTAPPAKDVALAARADALERAVPIMDQIVVGHRLADRTVLRDWVAGHVQLYRLAHRLREKFGPERAVAANPGRVTEVRGEWRGLFRSYRRIAVDLADPRIELGLERAVLSLNAIAVRCRQAQVALLIVILPTKESVFLPHVSDAAAPQLRAVADGEAVLRGRLIQQLRDARVDILDMLPPLRDVSEQSYPDTLDGHPNPTGHRIIAERVAAWVSKRL